MTRWLLIVSLLATACGGNSVPGDTKPPEADADDGSDGDAGDDGDGDDGAGDDGDGDDGDGDDGDGDGDDGDGGDGDDTGDSPDPGEPFIDDDGDGFSEDEGDCDDTDSTIYPGAEEAPGDGIDQDCNDSEICLADADDDGIIDDGTPTVLSTDGDCDDPYEGTFSDPLGDCDDGDAEIGLPTTWYRDGDDDGMGDATDSVEACDQPDGYVDNDIDPCVVTEGRAGGSGTEEDPYIVCDPVTLQNIQSNLGAHYLQTEDINLTDVSFTPIGDATLDFVETPEDLSTVGFYGHFNGDGHIIVGLSIDESDVDVSSDPPPTALFRILGITGSLTGIRLEDVSVHGARDTASLVGFVLGQVSDVHISGIITISGTRSVGGIGAYMMTADEVYTAGLSDIHVGAGNLVNRGTESWTPAAQLGAGGIIGGSFGGSLSDSTADINVKWEWAGAALGIAIAHSPAAGGAVGRVMALQDLSNVHTTGNVEGIHHVGGIAGEILNEGDPCSVSNSTASGNVTGMGEKIGGVAGKLTGHACQVGFTGTVSGGNMVGGVIGSTSYTTICEECFASGNVEAIDGLIGDSGGVGGLVGVSTGEGALQNSLFSGTVSTTTGGSNQYGGIIGVALFLGDDEPFAAESSLMMGAVSPEDGGLVIGAMVTDGDGTPDEDTAPYTDTRYVDLDSDGEPSLAYGEDMAATSLYWGEEVDLSEVASEGAYPSTFDFDSTWAMATTTDADSPMYGLTHPVLRWQCDHDPSISCDTLD
jgi:hypothetical protein